MRKVLFRSESRSPISITRGLSRFIVTNIDETKTNIARVAIDFGDEWRIGLNGGRLQGGENFRNPPEISPSAGSARTSVNSYSGVPGKWRSVIKSFITLLDRRALRSKLASLSLSLSLSLSKLFQLAPNEIYSWRERRCRTLIHRV